MIGGGNSLGKLIVYLGADVADLVTEFGKAEREAKKLVAEFLKAEREVKKLEKSFDEKLSARIAQSAAVMAAAAVGIGVAIKQATDRADELGKAAQRAGVAVEAFSKIDFAAGLAGVNTEQLQNGFTQLSKRIIDETSKTSQALEGLGVKTRDAFGQLRPNEDLLSDIAGLFGSFRDGAEKAALAQEIFGKSGVALIPLLNSGAEGLRAMTAEAEALGLAVSEDMARAAEDLNDNVSRLNGAWKGFANTLAGEVNPILAELTGEFVQFLADSGGVQNAAYAVGSALKTVGLAAALVKNVLDAMFEVLKAGFISLAEPVQFAGKQIANFAVASERHLQRMANGDGAFSSAIQGWKEFGSNLATDAEDSAGKIKGAFAGAIEGINADIRDVEDAFNRAGGKPGGLTSSAPPVDREREEALKRVQAMMARLATASSDATAQQRALNDAQRDAKAAAKEAEAAYKEYEAIMGRLLGKYQPLQAAEKEYREDLEKLIDAHDRGGVSMEEFMRAAGMLGREMEDTAKGIKTAADAMTPFEQAVQSLMLEIATLNGGDVSGLEAEFRSVTQGLGELTAEQQLVIRNLLLMKQGAANFAAVLGPISDAMSAALGEFGAEVLFTFRDIEGAIEDLGDNMLDIVKRTVAQMITEIARLRIINPILNGIFGSALPTGGIGNIASALGGAGGAGGSGSGIGAIGSVLGRLFGGGGASAASAALPQINVITGASSAAAGAGAAGAASVIPVIGWAVAAAFLVNAISGGRLFGTRYKPTSGATSFELGESGASATQSVSEARQRALFGGRQSRTRSVPASDDAVRAAQQLFDSVREVMADAARALEGDAPAMIDAALRTVQTFDQKGKLLATKFFVDVLGRTWEEATAEAAATRINAEGIIATIDSILGTTVAGIEAALPPVGTALGEGVGGLVRDITGAVDDAIKNSGGQIGEASAIAERWRGDAETLMDGAQFLLAAAVDIRAGVGLLGDGTLTEITDLIEELQGDTETLVDTYARVSGATRLLDEALALSGINLGRMRADVVRFATGIVEAAGGIQRAASLWQTYFDGFFTQAERMEREVSRTRGVATTELGDVGLDTSVTRAQFRQQFEDLLPTLSPEDVVQWLEAGAALDNMLGAETRLADFRAGEGAAAAREIEEAERAATEAMERLARAYTDQQGFIGGLEEEIQNTALSDYGDQIASLTRRYRANIATAEELGRATGDTDATMRSVTLATRIFRNGIAEVRNALIASIRGLVAQLGYTTGLALPGSEALPSSGGFGGGGGYEDASNAANSFFESLQSGFESLEQWLAQSIFGDLSGLSPEAQYSEVLQQINAAAALIRSGGVGAEEALNGFPELLNRFLQLSRQINASGANFGADTSFARSLAAEILALRTSLGGIGGPGFGGSGSSGGGGFTDPGAGAGPSTTAGQAAGDRLLLATQLAQQLRELAAITATPLLELAQTFGVDLERFFTDLGIDLDDLSANNVMQLGLIANNLGIDLSDIDVTLGLGLGDIADAMSPINDAIEGVIDTLPPELQAVFRPLLTALETAETPAERAQARAAFVAAILGASPDVQNVFAPYFSEIDPTDELSEILTEITSVSQYTGETVEAVKAVRDAVVGVAAPIVAGLAGLQSSTSSGLGDIVTAINNLAQQQAGESAQSDKSAERIATVLPGRAGSDSLSDAKSIEMVALLTKNNALMERLVNAVNDSGGGSGGIIGGGGGAIGGGTIGGPDPASLLSRHIAIGGRYGC